MRELIRVIPTKYKGFYFRSRIEARWAVFFDEMGIKWVYEPEGFELENGTWYVPDFYLPGADCYCEVKSRDFTDLEKEKCKLLTKGTGKDTILLDGEPDYINYICYCIIKVDDSVSESDVVFCNYKGEKGRLYYATGYEGRVGLFELIQEIGELKYYPEWVNAINKMRGYRFHN